MFQIIYKHYQTIEIASEMPISEEIYNALSIMFDPYAMYDMNCTMNGDTLHIRTKDKEEFGELCRLYGIAAKTDFDKMKYIAINLDA